MLLPSKCWSNIIWQSKRNSYKYVWSTSISTVTDFPKDFTELEKHNWYNYSLKNEYPNLISSSVEENRRVWQQMDVERMLDHHPTHEVHPRYIIYIYSKIKSPKKL